MSDSDDPENAAMAEWGTRLDPYLDSQEDLASLRAREQPHPPWPDPDNPMLGYLLARARLLRDEEGIDSAMLWLAVHAWFESAIDTRAELIRHLGS